MLLIIAVLALASTAFLLLRYVKRLDRQIPVPKTISPEPPLNARPLFMPSGDELHVEAKEREAKAIARRELRTQRREREIVDSALLAWRKNRNAKTTSNLLHAAVTSGQEGAFARAAKEILDDFRGGESRSMLSDDLASLIESHVKLLPNEERSSGDLFWVKREVEKLRENPI